MIKVYLDKEVTLEELRDKSIAILGYGNQGRAQALNLRDSGVKVVLGLREDGRSWKIAKKDGFNPLSFSEPNRYVLECGTDEGVDDLEFFITRIKFDSAVEVIGFNSMRWSSSYRSRVLDADELEDTFLFVCGVALPELWACDDFGCYISQERKFLGAVYAVPEETGIECFDWFYGGLYYE